MAKSQKKSNREIRKPKAVKPTAVPSPLAGKFGVPPSPDPKKR